MTITTHDPRVRLEILDASGNPTEKEPQLIPHTRICQFLMTYISSSDQVLKAESDCVDIAYAGLLNITDHSMHRTKNGEPHIYRLSPVDDPAKFEGIQAYAEYSARTLPHSGTR